MPETRLLATHAPRTTTLPRTQTAAIPGANPTGAFVSASPAAGHQVHTHAAHARQAASMPPSTRPPGVQPQAARVALISPAPRAAGGGAGFGGAMLATNQRPTVQLMPRPTSDRVQTQVPPGGGVSLTFEEACLVGQLVDRYIEGATAAKDTVGAHLGGATLAKMTAYVHHLAEMTAHAQAQMSPMPATAPDPVPLRVQVPTPPVPPVAAAWPPVAVPAWPPMQGMPIVQAQAVPVPANVIPAHAVPVVSPTAPDAPSAPNASETTNVVATPDLT